MAGAAIGELLQQVGCTFVSQWLEVDQTMIQSFADTTRDWNFLHLDPEQARAAGFGGTIAHGFLTLSLLAPLRMLCDRPAFSGFRAGVNYGLEGMRFIAPVPAGSRIRGHFTVESLAERSPGHWLEDMAVRVEIEGHERPALVAHWLTMYLE